MPRRSARNTLPCSRSSAISRKTSAVCCASLYGDDALDRARRFEEGDYAALGDCPLVLNSVDDISDHIERRLLKRAGITHPRVMATSSNAETLFALCTRGVGACFCPEILARQRGNTMREHENKVTLQRSIIDA